MKKRLFVFLAMAAMAVGLFAQDIIVTKDAQKVEAKILEVSETEIKYKDWSYLEGPTFSMKLYNISTIIYANGQVMTFNQQNEEAQRPARQPRPQPANSAPVQSAETATPQQYAAPAPRRSNLHFNVEPLTANRPWGVSIGYVQKQFSVDGHKQAWCSVKEKSAPSSSFQVGVVYAPEFRYGIGLQTGVYYELSASSESESEDGIKIKLSMDEHTLSIPLRVQYRYEIIPDVSIFLYTGPSFDISVAYNVRYSYDGEKEQFSMYDEETSELGIQRFNMLWGVGAGVRWKGLQLRLGGDWGMISMIKDASESVLLNKPFNISLQYLF